MTYYDANRNVRTKNIRVALTKLSADDPFDKSEANDDEVIAVNCSFTKDLKQYDRSLLNGTSSIEKILKGTEHSNPAIYQKAPLHTIDENYRTVTGVDYAVLPCINSHYRQWKSLRSGHAIELQGPVPTAFAIFAIFISILVSGSHLIQKFWPRANCRSQLTPGAEKSRLCNAVLLLFSIGLASGCTSPEFRGSAAKFGEAVQASASSQTKRLGTLTSAQIDDIRGGLAADRLHLSYSPGCAELLIPGAAQQNCNVVRTDGKPIPEAQTFSSILALNKAMGDYGKNLALLAADSSEEATAFNKSLLDLVVSFEGLGAALSNTGSAEATGPSGLNVFTTGVNQISGVFFAASRARKLREIIIATDPKIQAATKLLSRASEGPATFEITHAIEQADRTQVELRRSLASGAKTAKIAELQAKLFDEVAQIKQVARLKDTYGAIGKSHGELAKSARAGSSKDDLRAAIVELLQVASALKELDI